MNKLWRLTIAILLIFSGLWFLPVTNPIANADTISNSVYEYRKNHNPNGIGKFYMGREIAQVMGHQAAAWLERPSRNFEERPNLVVNALNLQPTDVVADIGAGTGYFSFRIARLLGQGKVLAVDIQPEMLDMINFL
ncbi:MAG TPA: methyltransferase domain-containing protein, partial [Phormidium sp.]